MSPSGRNTVAVVGGGVIGLTTASVLSDAHQVKIIARRLGERNESAHAVGSPARVAEVRLETESIKHGGTIIHN